MGKRLGGIFIHVGVGKSDRKEHDVIYNCSAWGKSQPTPPTCQPMMFCGALFDSVARGSSKVEFNTKTNLLDVLRDDMKRLQVQVARADRDKL